MTSGRATEEVFELLDIFLLVEAPATLNWVTLVTKLSQMLPQLKLGHGKPKDRQNPGSLERANADIKRMLVVWMSANNIQDWTVELKFFSSRRTVIITLEKIKHHGSGEDH